MNENTLDTAANTLQAGANETVSNLKTRAVQAADAAEDRANDLIGSAKDAVVHAADKASAAANKVSERAREVYGEAKGRADRVAQRVEPFVQERPYVALTVAAVVGFLIGVHMTDRRPRVVYVKPAD